MEFHDRDHSAEKSFGANWRIGVKKKKRKNYVCSEPRTAPQGSFRTHSWHFSNCSEVPGFELIRERINRESIRVRSSIYAPASSLVFSVMALVVFRARFHAFMSISCTPRMKNGALTLSDPKATHLAKHGIFRCFLRLNASSRYEWFKPRFFIDFWIFFQQIFSPAHNIL